MSYFKNLSKTVCSSRFNRSNNLIIRDTCTVATLLCKSAEPCADHANSVKALFGTISKLRQHSEGPYSKLVKKELDYLHLASKVYSDHCAVYVENGGYLTAQGAANLYACAEVLELSPKWLQTKVHPLIPSLAKNMSLENLADVAEGLKKYHPDSQFRKLVDAEMETRVQEPVEYVKRAVNEVVEFEETNYESNNLLLNVIENNEAQYRFSVKKWFFMVQDIYNSYMKISTGYILD